MKAGLCTKEEFRFFIWENEDDNSALHYWLKFQDYDWCYKVKDRRVYDEDDRLVFDFQDKPCFVVEGDIVRNYSVDMFNALYIVLDQEEV